MIAYEELVAALERHRNGEPVGTPAPSLSEVTRVNVPAPLAHAAAEDPTHAGEHHPSAHEIDIGDVLTDDEV